MKNLYEIKTQTELEQETKKQDQQAMELLEALELE